VGLFIRSFLQFQVHLLEDEEEGPEVDPADDPDMAGAVRIDQDPVTRGLFETGGSRLHNNIR
jgi:hypothetical protein